MEGPIHTERAAAETGTDSQTYRAREKKTRRLQTGSPTHTHTLGPPSLSISPSSFFLSLFFCPSLSLSLFMSVFCFLHLSLFLSFYPSFSSISLCRSRVLSYVGPSALWWFSWPSVCFIIWLLGSLLSCVHPSPLSLL